MIYKLCPSWGPKHFPTKTRISDMAIFMGTLCPYNVRFSV